MINFEWKYISEPPVRGIVLEERTEIDPVRRLLAHEGTPVSVQLLGEIDAEMLLNNDLTGDHLKPFDKPRNILAYYLGRAESPDARDAFLDMFSSAKNFSDEARLPQIILEGGAFNHFYTILGNTSLKGINRSEARHVKELAGTVPSPHDSELLQIMEENIDYAVRRVDIPVNMPKYLRTRSIVTGNPKNWLKRMFDEVAKDVQFNWQL